MIPLEKVKALVAKHDNLEKELSTGSIDSKTFAGKSKEYSDLGNIILYAREFLKYGNHWNKDSLSFDEEDEVDFKNFNQSKIFNKADIIIISYHFDTKKSFDQLNIFLEKFKNKKKIILTSNSNIYLSPK